MTNLRTPDDWYAEIKRQRRRALRRRSQQNWVLLGVTAATCVLVSGFLFWFTNVDVGKVFPYLVGGGMMVGYVVYWVGFGRAAHCPHCEADWDMNERSLFGTVETWQECPKCGLPFSRQALAEWLTKPYLRRS